ncbi:MAG TPA: UPF0262 family protein [Rhodospirillales bacterium]|nr:UPF0262 family protein [Rhodospirillales bacterium]
MARTKPADPTESRLVKVILDDPTLAPASAPIEHERKAAIQNLVEENYFVLANGTKGPYELCLGIIETRLVFDVRSPTDEPLAEFVLPLEPFRKIMRDYFVVYDSYFRAIKTLTAWQIETIDVGRRSLHDEGAEALRERLSDRVEIDLNTARRLFSLICALYQRR